MFARNALVLMLTMISVVAALALLGLLLLISTSPGQQHYRQLEATAGYLRDAVAMAQEATVVATRDEIPLQETAAALRSSLTQGSAALREQILRVYQSDSVMATLRAPAMRVFNALDGGMDGITDTEIVGRSLTELASRNERLVADLDAYQSVHVRYLNAVVSFEAHANELVRAFREGGRGQLADESYSATGQFLSLLRSGSEADVAEAAEILGRANVETPQLSRTEASQWTEIQRDAESVLELRADLGGWVAVIDFPLLLQRLDNLRTMIASDQLYSLATINDARVLLNIYTVMMLAVLVFFAARLGISHRSLNRSHEELEDRVRERTADLERAYDDLQESQVQLVQAEKMSSLGQLVAGVMHEINTPLLYVANNTAITAESVTGLVDYVKATLPIVQSDSPESMQAAISRMLARRQDLDIDGVEESADEVVALAADSREGLDQISELVQSLKDFSRLDRAAEDRFDVRDGIEKTLTITRNILKYGIEVRREFTDVPDIFCSPSRINQVFINLVTNATQAMDGQGTLTITTTSRDDWVEIGFADTGCGIPEENLNKIMDPFFTTKPVGQGTGLGLSIVRQIVEEHGGQILIDSKVGAGTCITLGFPVRRAASANETSQEVAA